MSMNRQPTTSQQLKVIYKNETKKFKKPTDYDVLYQQTIKAFGSTLPKNFKFFYQDSEGDLISISCQEDLEEAYDSMQTLRLFVEASIEHARQSIEPDLSMRSSLNMPMMMMSSQSQGISNIMEQQIHSARNRGISNDFENVPYYDQSQFKTSRDTHSIAIGGNEIHSQNASTDVQNLVGFQSISINTQGINTDEKQLNAVVDTKDMASQIQKDVKEVCCDGSIQTESKGSQFKMEVIEQEINCQIIRPEKEEESMNNDEAIVCFRCDGTKVNKKGLPCRRCNGSGNLNSKFMGDIVKILREEIHSYTTQTFQRLMVDYLGKRAADQQAIVHQGYICDGCNAEPITGIRYRCSVCANFDYCEKCEAEKPHSHPFLKIRKPEQAPVFVSCQYQSIDVNMNQSQQSQNLGQSNNVNQSQASQKPKRKSGEKKKLYQARFVKESFGDKYSVAPNQFFTKTWTFRNAGETEWPADAIFIQTNGDDLKAISQIVQGPVKPGMEITVSVDLQAPELPGKYCAFFRFVYGDNHRFGQKVWCDIMVTQQEPEQKIRSTSIPSLNLKVISKNNSNDRSVEERSSLLNESDNINSEQIVSLENVAEKYQEMQKRLEEEESQVVNNDREQLKKTIKNIMDEFEGSQLSNSNNKMNKSQFEELVNEDSSKVQNLNVSEIIQDKVEDKKEEDDVSKPLVKSELSAQDKEKIIYLEDIEKRKIKDKALIDNLLYMFDAGFSNFKINYQLLVRNQNDLTIAINLLCNGIISDSMLD